MSAKTLEEVKTKMASFIEEEMFGDGISLVYLAKKMNIMPNGARVIAADHLFYPTNDDLVLPKPEALHAKVKAFVRKYLELDTEHENIFVDYIIYMWRGPLSGQVKYLQILGDWNTRKSRAGILVKLLVPHAIHSSNCMSGHTLIAMLHDEFMRTGNFVASILNLDGAIEEEYREDIWQVLRNGAIRAQKLFMVDDGLTAYGYHIFGPKVLLCTKKFRDASLQSKCISIKLSGLDGRTDIPEMLSASAGFGREVSEVRAELHAHFKSGDM